MTYVPDEERNIKCGSGEEKEVERSSEAKDQPSITKIHIMFTINGEKKSFHSVISTIRSEIESKCQTVFAQTHMFLNSRSIKS